MNTLRRVETVAIHKTQELKNQGFYYIIGYYGTGTRQRT